MLKKLCILVYELKMRIGLCGIVAAHLSSKVVMTDYDLDSLQLLQKNIDSNALGIF